MQPPSKQRPHWPQEVLSGAGWEQAPSKQTRQALHLVPSGRLRHVSPRQTWQEICAVVSSSSATAPARPASEASAALTMPRLEEAVASARVSSSKR
jgi:hypothetical protein